MSVSGKHFRSLLLAFCCVSISTAQAGEELSREAIKEFLRTAKIVKSRPIGKGTTDPWRLTLSDGKLTHDAAFQSVDERKVRKDMSGGLTELNFRDSFEFNVAASELAEILGIGHMVPPTVRRSFGGKNGAVSWWVDSKWDENEWKASGVQPPDTEAWNRQIFKVRLFSALLYDTDRNRGNMLITEDWKVWMIDFTRAFRRWHKLQTKAGLIRCDRQLYERLKGLTVRDLEGRLGRLISETEREALLVRRDLLVEHFESLAREIGPERVFY